MSKKVKRLFEQFQPEHYDLRLDIDPERMVFAGKVVIDGRKVGRPSQRITFHQKGLKITSAKIIKHDKRGDEEIAISRINTHKSYDEVRLHSAQMIYPGNYTVELEFSGKITRNMEGIYPSFFKHVGKDKKIIATQFESHHAREAFPCLDEPEAKATFDLTLTTPKNQTVLANTPAKTSKTSSDKLTTSFETTPKMSTYLLAFAFGELHCVEAKTKSSIAVRTWATIAQPKSHLDYANKEAIDCLDFFENYFKTPFPLPKLDQLALPDFDSLAMENWGLVTFREIGLLADPNNRSISGERLITQVVAHELSHQWFGNLVTMKWWDDLWLNESFATVMESLAPDRLHPEWQEWEDFTSSRVIGAAVRDVYKDVQPVGVKVSHPDEILSLFDPSIVYAKGARILKMLFDFIGEETFGKGLSIYFAKHAYGNTTRQDLWEALSEASKMDIGKLMTPWIEQSGTPELVIKQSDDALELSQERFMLDGEDKTSLWPIPLLADTKIEPKVLGSRSEVIKVSPSPIFNPTGSGHFIVRYEDKSTAERLLAKLKDRSLPTSGRIISLNDMLLEAKKGRKSLVEILKLVEDCKAEDRDGVWQMFSRTIGSAASLIDGDLDLEAKLRAFQRQLAADWYDKLGWTDQPDDDVNTKHLRTTMVALTVGSESEPAVDIALAKFSEAKSVEALPAEQRAIIARAAVRFGKPSYIQQLMKEYEASGSSDVQESIAAALCSTRDKTVAQKIADWGFNDPDIIRIQDITHWFAFLMRNHYTRDVAWQWLTGNWQEIEKNFGGGKSMEYFIWYASGPIATESWQKKYTEFFEPMLDNLALKRNILISFSEIQARVDWRQRDLPVIKKFLG